MQQTVAALDFRRRCGEGFMGLFTQGADGCQQQVLQLFFAQFGRRGWQLIDPQQGQFAGNTPRLHCRISIASERLPHCRKAARKRYRA